MNLFETLKRRKPKSENLKEDYLTASFALLLYNVPELTRYLVKEILGDDIGTDKYEIKLWKEIKNVGFPDILIESPSPIYIENKLSSGESSDKQFIDYSKYARETNSGLILLSRDFIDNERLDECRKYGLKHVYWGSGIYRYIKKFQKEYEGLLNEKYKGKEKFLINEFLCFLEEEDMSDEKVSEEINGTKYFFILIDMILLILKELKKDNKIISFTKKSFGKDFAGIYFKKFEGKGNEFWIGVYRNELDKVYIQVLKDFREKHKEIKNYFETLYEKDSIPSYKFSFIEKNFFSFTKEKQKNLIKEFVINSLDELDRKAKETGL